MRRAVLLSLLVCARIGADDCEQSGTLTFAYFAVGQRTLTKARRSAVSAKRAHAGRAQTLLLTDRRGVAAATAEARACAASAAAGPAFDDVLELAEAENATAFAAMPEFVAFRTFVTANKLQSRHAAWTDRDNFNNRAVSDLRLAKIRSLEAALKRSRASAVVFLDADTVVCRSLLKYACAAEKAGADVAFVPVPAEKLHASPQLRRTYGVAPETPEANTGALFLRRTPKALSLLRYWGLRYGELRAADPPQLMDQVAFRAALHASRAKWLPVEERANCRGRDHLTRAHAPLACDGLESHAPQLREQIMKHTGSFVSKSDDPETSLKALRAMEHVVEALDGGRACDVLHTHEATDYRDDGEVAAVGPCYWVDVPFAYATPAARDAARAALVLPPICRGLADLGRSAGVDYGATPRGRLVVHVPADPVARVAREFDACCRGGAAEHGWCARAPCGGGGGLGAYAERRENAALAAVAPGEACAAARRPPPSKADLRVAAKLAPEFAVFAAVDALPAPAGHDAADLARAHDATALDRALAKS